MTTSNNEIIFYAFALHRNRVMFLSNELNLFDNVNNIKIDFRKVLILHLAEIKLFVSVILRIKNSVAIGISIGAASHAVGTTKAFEIGETEGAMSSLSIGIAGIITVLIAPPIFTLAMKILQIG